MATVHLDHAVRSRPGLRLPSTPTTLLCSSDDPAGHLFGITKPLLRVDLSAAPANSTSGVTLATSPPCGSLTLRSACSSDFEAEGIDYDRRTGTLRVIVVSPGSAC